MLEGGLNSKWYLGCLQGPIFGDRGFRVFRKMNDEDQLWSLAFYLLSQPSLCSL